MTTFAEWVNDWRWAMNVKRARAWRRQLIFSQRLAFDKAIRPVIGDSYGIIDYPDAFYAITINDLCRAIEASYKQRSD